MSRTLVLVGLVCSAVLVSTVLSAACHSTGDHRGPANMIPIYTQDPVFVRKVKNGELYTAGTGEDTIHLLHVWGDNGYDWGYAAGQLLKEEMTGLITTAFDYFKTEIMNVINKVDTKDHLHIPEQYLKLIGTVGFEAALDTLYYLDKKYVDEAIFDEMRGISNATGLNYDKIVWLHWIGEITRASCSFYGLWGSATKGGNTLQLRALDWNTKAGMQNFPVVTVYHPLTPKMGYAFANVGWAGWIGTLTGMSSQRIGISEIGIDYPSPNYGNESWVGFPFVFLERKIIQFATSYKEAETMITDAKRTCRLVLGVGDGNAKTARLVQYSATRLEFYNDKNLQPLEPWHPRIDDSVYCAMDWMCPYFQRQMYEALTKFHGTLTPELSISNVTAVVRTGSLHAAVYDLTDLTLHVANARRAGATGPLDAYARQWTKFDMNKEFARKQPTDEV